MKRNLVEEVHRKLSSKCHLVRRDQRTEPVKSTGPLPVQLQWDSNIVDGNELYTLLGYKSRDAGVIGEEAFRRILDFETAVDRWHARGRLTRVVARDKSSGKVLHYGYKRDELLALLRQTPGLAGESHPSATRPAMMSPAPPIPRLQGSLAVCPLCHQPLRCPNKRPTVCQCGALAARRELGRSGTLDVVLYLQGKEGWRAREGEIIKQLGTATSAA